MASLVQGYEYDIFISYRHNDNRSGWVTEFVAALQEELATILKEPVSVFYDTNPHDGLLESHSVDKSLRGKLKCLLFIPIISQTYCDTKSFAWQNEFCVFNKLAKDDQFGRDIRISNGNVASRVLPVRIHDLDPEDKALLENELEGALRSIEFIFRTAGVNRPLRANEDHPRENLNKTYYRDQINKVANAVKEIISGIKSAEIGSDDILPVNSPIPQTEGFHFIGKLKSRNVFRACLVYLLTALIFWRVLLIGSDLMKLTENSVKLICLLLIVMFPFAMLLAWLYERGPTGFIRTGSVASLENPFSHEKKKPLTSTTFIALLVVTSLAIFLLFPIEGKTSTKNSAAREEKSIAVLPFENLSNNPENEYFSKGVVDAINRYLSQISQLKVILLTSSDVYKNSSKSSREISKELAVSNLLKGSVQRFKNMFRIEVELIDADTEQQLWADKFDREIDDIFKIQSEIAESVVKALKSTLSEEDKAVLNEKMTSNAKAYELYLKGNYEISTFSRTGIHKAIDYFNQTIDLDPGFALAYSGIGSCIMAKAGIFGAESNALDALSEGIPYINKALELDPGLAEAHAQKGFYLLYNNWDFQGAEQEYKKAILTNNSFALGLYCDYLNFVNRPEEALIIAQRQNQSDPFNPGTRMIFPLFYLGRYKEAAEFTKSRQKLFQNNLVGDDGFLFLNTGQYDEAIESFEKSLKKDGVRYPRILGWLGAAYAHSGRKDKAMGIIEELQDRCKISHAGSVGFFIAVIYAALGNNDDAMHWLEEAYKYHEMEIPWLKSEPQFYSLKDNPEFKSLLLKVGFP